MLKLDIGGCGGLGKRDIDYLSVDMADNADVKAQMWELPYKDLEVDEIWSSHTLEHSGVYKVGPTLSEWFRVLKYNGKLNVTVPNFEYVARYFLTCADSDRPWAEAMIFGTQANDGEYHKCAFTARTLRADLEAAGFEVVMIKLIWSHNQETLHAVCKKPEPKQEPKP